MIVLTVAARLLTSGGGVEEVTVFAAVVGDGGAGHRDAFVLSDR